MEWQVPKIWSGTCFIIGGGPSLASQFNVPDGIVPEEREEFLEFGTYLSQIKNEHIIGVNLAAFLGNFVDVAYWGDSDTYSQYKAWFDAFGGLKVSSAGKFADPKYKSIKHLYKEGSIGISQKNDELSWVGKNSGASAINLAVHLGCTKIVLLGFDMQSHTTGRKHWHTGYPDKLYAPSNKDLKEGKTWVPREINPKESYNRHLAGFPEVATDAKKYGIEIINLCPDSMVDQFPKMSVKEYFEWQEGIKPVKQIKVNKSNTTQELCFCGGHLKNNKTINGIDTLICPECKAIKQDVGGIDLKEYYQKQYHQKAYTHTLKQDAITAKKRYDKYQFIGITDTGRWLDLGAGNCAFTDFAKQKGIDCFSLDVTEKCKVDFYNPIEDVYFPTDHFSCICLHDVLEHLDNPFKTLSECFRVLEQNGTLVLEFPDFFSNEGKRHWKKIEHLWMLSYVQILSMLEKVGFEINQTYVPVPGKTVYIATKPKQYRVKILVPPGIGDIHWVLVKLQSFLRKKGITDIPDVYIASMNKKKDRAIDYLKLFPFIHAAGYKYVSKKEIPWKEAYNESKRTVFEDVAGCDYFIAYNGQLRKPKTLEQIDSQYPCKYDLPMFESLKERLYGEKATQDIGRYIVAYFVDTGMYASHWMRYLSKKKILRILTALGKELNCKIVLVGSEWDINCKVNQHLINNTPEEQIVDLLGKTDIEQLFGLMKNSVGVIGFPSGLTIMSTYFKIPTYIFWSDYFNLTFWEASCRPGTVGISYMYEDVRTINVEKVVKEFKSIIPEFVVDKTNYVVCVLKSGGDYTADYVTKLRAMTKRNLSQYFEFRCLTDIDNLDIPKEEIIQLENDWPGWWSKVEIFKKDLFPNGNVVYLDLDTVITGNIDSLFDTTDDFRMLEGFGTAKPMASGIMSFQTDLSFIYKKLLLEEGVMVTPTGNLRWDQRFIAKEYKENTGNKPGLIQSDTKVASYKKDVKTDTKNALEVPIICFHGKPRPHECNDEQITKYWRV